MSEPKPQREQGHRVRQPLYSAPKPAAAAGCYAESPALQLEALYRRIWETSMHDMPFVNAALSVAAIGFRRHEGDWVGAMITPWFLNLFILPGGGELWSDLASGDRVKIPFPVGTLEFIADYDPGGDIPAYQYCPLFAPVSQFASHEAAVSAAEEALAALFSVAPAPAADVAEPVQQEAVASLVAEPESIPSRRAFLRGLAGRRP
jgi:[NiFe] hydrogenase assembly HybE family chaperone